MQPLKGLAWGCALAIVLIAGPAHAGWNNVFQVCCSSCGGQSAPVVAGASPDCCQPPPSTVCTTRYIQRTYYQPVTSYQMSTYSQPVTTYRTSYYYEPVCSYRYSCYYDPCTCSYQQVAVPTTSYQIRSQCCPVTTYLQRTCMKPVTTMKAMCYYEPVTTCTQQCSGSGLNGSSAAPASQGDDSFSSPDTDAIPAPPSGTSQPKVGSEIRRQWQPPARMNDAPRDEQMKRRAPEKAQERPVISRPNLLASTSSLNVEGRVVNDSRRGQASAKVLFVNAERKSERMTVTADREGNFRVHLEEGAWLVYTYDEGGNSVFAKRLEVPASRTIQVSLMNR